MPLFVLRWLHRQRFSRPRLKGTWLHRWLGDRLMDKRLWLATPESLARAWLIGFPITTIPFLPAQSIIAGLIGFFWRGNLFLCVGLQYLSNPLTAIVQSPACYLVGKMLLGTSPVAVWHEMQHRNWGAYITHPSAVANDLLPIYLGAVVLGLALGGLGYVLILNWGNKLHQWRERQRRARLAR